MKIKQTRHTVQVSSETIKKLALIRKRDGVPSKFLIDKLVEKFKEK